MRAINHSLTGALIGLTVAEPAIAIPLAFVSHFILDAIPHHGRRDEKHRLKDRSFIYLLFIDAFLCGLLVLVLALSKPIHWPLAIICAFTAASPDFFSFNRFYKTLKGRPWKPSLFSRFASKIQWFEKPVGVVVEITWLIATVFCVSIFLNR